VKFKGKGHEAADLKVLMSTLEHWAHRLYPKAPFDDFIGRMERLGKKKDYGVLLNRIRTDMPVLDGDYVTPQFDDEEGDGELAAAPPPRSPTQEDVFDEIMREQEDAMADRHASNAPPQPPPSAAAAAAKTSNQEGISAEARARMERNKRIAMEKRMKRLGLTQPPAAAGVAQESTKACAPEVKDCEPEVRPIDVSGMRTELKIVPSPGKSQTESSKSEMELEDSRAKARAMAERSPPASLHLHLTETEQSETPQESLNLHMSETAPQSEDAEPLCRTEPTAMEEDSIENSMKLHVAETEEMEESCQSSPAKICRKARSEHNDSVFEGEMSLTETGDKCTKKGSEESEEGGFELKMSVSSDEEQL